MSSFLKSYISFTRKERAGIIALLILLVLLIIGRVTMRLFVTPDTSELQQQKLAQAWASFQKEQNTLATEHKDSIISTMAQGNAKPQYQAKNTITQKLFFFDPNTIDSTGLRRLGLKEKTTMILLHWRAKGKVFHKKEELKKLYTLTEEEYNRLEPYIHIR